MFLIDQFSSSTEKSLPNVSFRIGNSKEVKVDYNSYIQLYSEYINNPSGRLIENVSKIRTLRFEIIGDTRNDMEDDDIELFYRCLSDGTYERSVCSVFTSDASICLHFPFSIYKPSKYRKIIKSLKEKLKSELKEFDIEDDVIFNGENGDYDVLGLKTDQQPLSFEYFFPGKGGIYSMSDYDLNPSNHTIVEKGNITFDCDDELMYPLLFSPLYKSLLLGDTTDSDTSSIRSTSSIHSQGSFRSSFSGKNDSKCKIINKTTNLGHKVISDNDLNIDPLNMNENQFLPSKSKVLDLTSNNDDEIDLSQFDNLKVKLLEDANHRNIHNHLNLSRTAEDELYIKETARTHSYAKDISSDDPGAMFSFLYCMLDPSRYLNDYTWREIGSVAKSSFESKEEGIAWWLLASLDAEREVTKEEIQKEWEMLNPDYSIKTLAHYAREDRIVAYKLWYNNWLFGAMEEAIDDSSDMSIAKFIYRLYFLDYIIINGKWMKLNYNRCCLETCTDGWIMERISRHICSPTFEWQIKCGVSMTKESLDLSTSDATMKDYRIKLDNLLNVLKTSRRLSGIISFCKSYFTTEIKKPLDDDPHKMAWLEEVSIATSQGVILVRPKLEDFITLCTGVRIAKSNNTPEYRALKCYIESVFPNGLDDSFMKDLAGILRGGNLEKRLKVMLGGGNNSKSCLMNLIQYTIGDYFISIGIGAFDTKKGDNASPQLAQCRGKRLVSIADPNENQTLGMSVVKAITGGDPIYTRLLNENGGMMKTDFRIYMSCNTLPKLDSFDEAAEARFLVFPFLGRWVEDPSNPKYKDEKYLRKIDPNFKDTYMTWKSAMARMLMEFYPKYLKDEKTRDRYKHPLIVAETKKQWNDNNPFVCFFLSNYEKSVTGTVNVNTIKKEYNAQVERIDKQSRTVWFEKQLASIDVEKSPENQLEYIGWEKIKTELSL